MSKGHEVEQEVLYMPDLCVMLGTTRETLRGMVRRGELPAPFKLGRRVAWRRCDILHDIERKAQQAERARLI